MKRLIFASRTVVKFCLVKSTLNIFSLYTIFNIYTVFSCVKATVPSNGAFPLHGTVQYVRQMSRCKPNTSMVADEIAEINANAMTYEIKRPHVLKSGLIKCWQRWKEYENILLK